MEMPGQTRETNARSKRFYVVTMLLCNGRKKSDNEHSRIGREGKFIAIRDIPSIPRLSVKEKGKEVDENHLHQPNVHETLRGTQQF
jgi:hypothetical protein